MRLLSQWLIQVHFIIKTLTLSTFMATKESNTRSFVLRIDGETMDALEKWAADEFRSTNGQLQWIIAEALRRSGRKPRAKKSKEGRTNED